MIPNTATPTPAMATVMAMIGRCGGRSSSSHNHNSTRRILGSLSPPSSQLHRTLFPSGGGTSLLLSPSRHNFSSMTDDLQHFSQRSNTNNNNNGNNLMLKKPKYHLPKRIILLRHGESLGNIDETAYASIPDWKIPLTRRGERQAQRVAEELATLLDGESLFCYCSPYKRTMETWNVIEQHLTSCTTTTTTQQDGDDGSANRDKQDDDDNNSAAKKGVEVIGMREEPRIAEQQFGNFQNPKKVRTAKSERRMFGRFFFRFPNGEAGLDVYNRVSSFLATLSRDIRQIDQLYSIRHDIDSTTTTEGGVNDKLQAATTYPLDDHNVVVDVGDCDQSSSNPTLLSSPSLDSNVNSGQFPSTSSSSSPSPPPTTTGEESDTSSSAACTDAMENMNILIVTHGLTLRLLLMRYFQLSVEEFEQSYNSQNARLVIMDRFVVSEESKTARYDDQREFYRLHEEAKEALNLKGDVSNEKPVYWRDTGRQNDSTKIPGLGGNHRRTLRQVPHGWGSAGVTERELGGLWSLAEEDDIEE